MRTAEEARRKVQEAAQKRSGKAGKLSWESIQYTIWIWVSLLVVFVAVAVVLFSPQKKDAELLVNDRELIKAVNRMGGFKAAPSPAFEGWTLIDAKKTVGGSFWSKRLSEVPECPISLEAIGDIPSEFDARKKWPTCFAPPYAGEKNCSASWAVAVATSISNRLCASLPDVYPRLRLAPQSLLSCDSMNSACEGGMLDAAFSYAENVGLVSEECFPWKAKAVSCSQKCDNEKTEKIESSCTLPSEESIQREVFAHGPVVGNILVNDDYLVYSEGIYKPMKTAKRLNIVDEKWPLTHAVKIIGWGVEGKSKFWLVEESFGSQWGMGGYAKLWRGLGQEAIVLDFGVLTFEPHPPVGKDSPAASAEDPIDLGL